MLRTPPLEPERSLKRSPERAPEPESPPMDEHIFVAEILGAVNPIYYDYTIVNPDAGLKGVVRRHSAAPKLATIGEAPETLDFEQYMPFRDTVAGTSRTMKRRTVRGGTRKIRGAQPPGLQTVSEEADYPESSRIRSPRGAPSPCEPPCSMMETPSGRLSPRQRRAKVRKSAVSRRIDFDAVPPSPQTPKRAPCAPPDEDEIEYGPIGPPPEDLIGVEYPIQYDQLEVIKIIKN